MLSAEQRLPSARIATGLGVFSSSALGDLYARIYDGTDASDLPETDAWQLRLAFVARDEAERVAAMRRLWGDSNDPLQRLAGEALLSLAASRLRPTRSTRRPIRCNGWRCCSPPTFISTSWPFCIS